MEPASILDGDLDDGSGVSFDDPSPTLLLSTSPNLKTPSQASGSFQMKDLRSLKRVGGSSIFSSAGSLVSLPSHPNQLDPEQKKFRESYLDDIDEITTTAIDVKKAVGVYKIKSQKQMDSNFIRYLTLLTITIAMANESFIVREVYQQNASILYEFGEDSPWMSLSSVNKLDDIYQYLEKTILEVYAKDWSQEQVRYAPYGDLLLRQIRVKNKSCMIQALGTSCHNEISDQNIDKNPFGPATNPSKYQYTSGYNPLRSGYYWSMHDVLYGLYGSGAHAIMMPQNSSIFSSQLSELKEDEWLSLSTVGVSVNFGYVNSEASMATSVEIIFEIFPTGYIHKTATVSSFPLTRLKESGYVALYGAFMSRIILEMFYESYEALIIGWRKYLSVGWNVLNLLSLVFLITVGISLNVTSNLIRKCLDDITSMSEQIQNSNHHVYLDYETAAYQYTILRGIAGFSCFLVVFKLFKYFRYHKNLNFIWKILSTAASKLLTFTLVFVMLLSSFSVYGYFSFGNSLEEFHTWWLSMITTFCMLSANFEVERFARVSPFWGFVFVITFIVFICLIFVNVFIAILSSTYETLANKKPSAQPGSITGIRSDESTQKSKSNIRSRLQGFGVQIHLANEYEGTIFQKDLVTISSKVPNQKDGSKEPVYVAKSRHLSSRWIQKLLSSTDILCFESFDGSDNKLYLKRSLEIRNRPILKYPKTDGEVEEWEFKYQCVLDINAEGYLSLRLSWMQSFSLFSLAFLIVVKGLIWSHLEVFHKFIWFLFKKNRNLPMLADESIEAMFEKIISEKSNNTSQSHIFIRFHELLCEISEIACKQGASHLRGKTNPLGEAVRIYHTTKEEMCVHPINKENVKLHEFVPRPIPSTVNMSLYGDLVYDMASFIHDRWCIQKLQSGWSYNEIRNDEKKKHQCLRPSRLLGKDFAFNDRLCVLQTLRVLITFGCNIIPPPDDFEVKPPTILVVENGIYQGELKVHPEYTIYDYDKNKVPIPKVLETLPRVFGENFHEAYCQKDMRNGWSFGTHYNPSEKKNPMLVPYCHLDKESRESNNSAFYTVVTYMTAHGYRFFFDHDYENDAKSNPRVSV